MSEEEEEEERDPELPTTDTELEWGEESEDGARQTDLEEKWEPDRWRCSWDWEAVMGETGRLAYDDPWSDSDATVMGVDGHSPRCLTPHLLASPMEAESNEPPSTNELYLCSPTVKRFWLMRSQLRVQEGVLYYHWEGYPARLLFLVPRALREEVLQGCHDCPTAGHLGQRKTLAQVKRSFIWHDMQSDIIEYVRTCRLCNRNKKPRVKPRAGLGCFHAGARMERVHMDMLGPFP